MICKMGELRNILKEKLFRISDCSNYNKFVLLLWWTERYCNTNESWKNGEKKSHWMKIKWFSFRTW